ncbi:MAG: CotH kinase family protein [Bacteroidota bacterium]
MKATFFLLLLFINFNLLAQDILESSNLPILVISTDNGQSILDEPKIDAHLGVIWNGDNEVNNLTDAFNNYDGKIGIEKRGSSSQAFFPKVGYAMETRNADNSNNNISLLGLPAENDWVLHGPYSDKSLMRNALAYILAGRIMDYAPRVRFCEVVLNDDYRGVYILTEKIKRDKNRVDISTLNPDENSGDDLTGGYILKFDKFDGAGADGFLSQHPSTPGGEIKTTFQYHYPKFDEITPQQELYIQGYIKELEQVLLSEEFADSVDGYRKYLDIRSMMQFIFIQEIGRNVDGYRLSTFFYKDRNSINAQLKFGPIWDFNLAFGNVSYCTGPGIIGWAWDFNDFCPNDFWVVHFWWERIMEDTAFTSEIKTYWNTLRQSQLSDQQINHLVDSLEQLLQVPAARNFERWPVIGEPIWPNDFIGNNYQEEVDHVRNWIGDRLNWMDNNIHRLGPPTVDPAVFVQPETLPNPFGKHGITFKYYCNDFEFVYFDLYNAQGQRVDKWIDNRNESGERIYEWNKDIPNGTYFYNMRFGRGEHASGIIIKSQ